MKLVIAAIMTSLSLPSAFADDGRIEFTGSITDEACTVVNNVGNPLKVVLGDVSSKAFSGAGTTAAPRKFTIALTDCPDTVSSASVTFDGTADINNKDILQLTQETGVATGVGIQLSDISNNPIPLYTWSESFPLVEGNNELDFIARYYATSATVTAGPANATSNFTILYN